MCVARELGLTNVWDDLLDVAINCDIPFKALVAYVAYVSLSTRGSQGILTLGRSVGVVWLVAEGYPGIRNGGLE